MDAEIQLVELLHRLSRKIGKTLAPMLREQVVSHTDMVVLFMMNKKGKSRVIELATRIGIPASTLTGILDRLVAQGYLEREPDPEDRRSLVIMATPKLRSFIGGLMVPMENKLKEVFKAMSASRIHRLIGDLEFVLHSLEETDGKTEPKYPMAHETNRHHDSSLPIETEDLYRKREEP